VSYFASGSDLPRLPGDHAGFLSYVIESLIEVPPATVFDFCSDLRNELVWNPNAEEVDKLTDGPVDMGTLFRARWANAGEVTVEMVEYDPPSTWATRSIARGMEVVFRGSVVEAPGGSRYAARMTIRPSGLAWLYAPVAWLAMRGQDTTNMRLIRETLESKGKRTDGGRDTASREL
jgi:hypothetical protein